MLLVGAEESLVVAEESLELPVAFSVFSAELFEAVAVEPEPELSHEVLLYPSAYQPPPLSLKELMDISFLIDPEHSGQVVNGSSVIR